MTRERIQSDLSSIAEWAVEFGRKSGADEIEISMADSSEFTVEVRQGEIEHLVEAGSRHLGFRLIKDNRTASAASSDLNRNTLERMIKRAVHRAEMANPDPFSGLPEKKLLTADIHRLRLYDPELETLTPEKKIGMALETESIGLKDNRITNSHGASFETRNISSILANSKGFLDSYKETYCGLSLGLQAGKTDEKVEDFYSSGKRFFNEIEPPEVVAARAVERTVRQLNPRKLITQKAPVVFEPRMTSWLMGFLFACVSGTAVYQKTSFLAGKLGKRIGAVEITVVDDGLMPGKLGSIPFDSEGVPAERTTVIGKGILKNFLCDTYAAKKLGLRSTGNADGAGIGPTNFYLQAGPHSQEEIISQIERGLLLTRTIGHGLNPVNGDISRGAFGLWIEDGQLAYPVSEITISGNLGSILKEIEFIGNDLDFRSSVCGPSIKVAEMTLAGKAD